MTIDFATSKLRFLGISGSLQGLILQDSPARELTLFMAFMDKSPAGVREGEELKLDYALSVE